MSNQSTNPEIKIKPIIAFDLDGTLSESKQSITESMAELLLNLAQKTKVAIISGGSYSQFNIQLIPVMIKKVVEEIAEQEIFSKEILKNIILMPTSGSVRYEYSTDIDDWKRSKVYPFPEDIRQRVKDRLEFVIFNNKEEYGITDECYGERIEDRETQVTFSGLGQDAPNDRKILWDPDMQKRMKLKTFIELEIPEVEGRIGGMTSLDILPRGFDKAVGLKALLEDLNLEIKDMLFIGDAVFEGGNDYSPVVAGIDTIGVSGPKQTEDIIKAILNS